MRERHDDLADLQAILDKSYERAGSHLRSIITPERHLRAGELAKRLTGMRLLTLATTTRPGRPMTSPVDGIFYRGRFWFGSSPTAVKMRHITERPAVSATHLDGEAFSVTVHGQAEVRGTTAQLTGTEFGEVARSIYGDSWNDWAHDALYASIEPERMFVFLLEHGE